jgi:hypothetical protein
VIPRGMSKDRSFHLGIVAIQTIRWKYAARERVDFHPSPPNHILECFQRMCALHCMHSFCAGKLVRANRVAVQQRGNHVIRQTSLTSSHLPNPVRLGELKIVVVVHPHTVSFQKYP